MIHDMILLSRALDRYKDDTFVRRTIWVSASCFIIALAFFVWGVATKFAIVSIEQHVLTMLCSLGLPGYVIIVRERYLDSLHAEAAVTEAKQLSASHPEEPKYAWDYARSSLERYLDRNQREARTVFWLTIVIMAIGFGLVVWGILQAFDNPDALSVSIVSSASGVLVSFIGGSFMLVYRSVLAQSARYVGILERINAVGMAVQITSTVSSSAGNDLKDQTKAELARSILSMYAKAD